MVPTFGLTARGVELDFISVVSVFVLTSNAVGLHAALNLPPLASASVIALAACARAAAEALLATVPAR